MRTIRRPAVLALLPAFALMPVMTAATSHAQEATPPPSAGCEALAASPVAARTGMPGTPMAGHGHEVAGEHVELDQLYIDMMLPHHASIIALAETAQGRLADARLQALARSIITAQSAENEEMRAWREEWYGSAEPMPMDESMMGMMMEMLPGMGDMASMEMQMDAQALVSAFCAGEDPDLTFIDLVIPHHAMAVQASETVRDQATHEELRALAGRVIRDQQAEIDELEAIRAELTGAGTPAAS